MNLNIATAARQRDDHAENDRVEENDYDEENDFHHENQVPTFFLLNPFRLNANNWYGYFRLLGDQEIYTTRRGRQNSSRQWRRIRKCSLAA